MLTSLAHARRLFGYQVASASLSLTIPIIPTSTGRIFTRFSPSGSDMAVDERHEPRFSNFQGTLHSNQLSFSEISFFFAGTPKRRQIHGPEHMVLRKGNIGNFVFCRMAPSVMTSGDPESQNCSRFVLRRFFSRADRPTGVDDCCKIGLLSIKGRCFRRKLSCQNCFKKQRRIFDLQLKTSGIFFMKHSLQTDRHTRTHAHTHTHTHTGTPTMDRATCAAIGRIYAMHAMRPNNNAFQV